MDNKKIHPLVLVILDGWGYNPENIGNAIALASTPTIDTLLQVYPNTLLKAAGVEVGLPVNQVGNSEVGHTTIGAGRVLMQDLAKIEQSIRDHSFFSNSTLLQVCNRLKRSNTTIHLVGLCSNGGVHSHINHLLSLLDLFYKHKILNVCIHLISDGRDTNPNCVQEFIILLKDYKEKYGIGDICTISGRYYAMDRDCRWSRTEAFYKVLVNDNDEISQSNDISAINFIQKCYNQQISDEFIPPTRLTKGKVKNGDTILFFNFRPDRMRQIVQSFIKTEFKGFPTVKFDDLDIVTFTNYDSSFKLPVVFPPISTKNFLGEVLSHNNLVQLRIAETEKYAHVTYFFNGGHEEPFDKEDRELIPSPQVATYDLSPQMSALQITNQVINALDQDLYSVIIVNYANPDMLGHTGNLDATIKAVECTDDCIAQLLNHISLVSGTMIITADHGNAEVMLDDNGQPCKSHTMNQVPFILIEGEKKRIIGHGGQVDLRSNGSLADIAPTILDILGLQIPDDMTGSTLITTTPYELRDMNQVIKQLEHQ